MQSAAYFLRLLVVAPLVLGMLMVVHEGGHMLAARAFGMRVITFSLGFGPALWRFKRKDGGTVYQIAVIPFLAFVQIAGMNPLEEVDPEDKGSFANASLLGRISAIFGGPAANYLFASVLFFAAFLSGVPANDGTVRVGAGGRAEAGGMLSGDRVVRIARQEVKEWGDLYREVTRHPEEATEFEVLRDGQRLTLTITPDKRDAGKDKPPAGFINVRPALVPAPLGTALTESAVVPLRTAIGFYQQISEAIRGKGSVQLTGPIGIIKATADVSGEDLFWFLSFVGQLSTMLAVVNLFPLPGLDGGRLMFLLYEFVSRRRADATIEARIHTVGILMLLGLAFVVMVTDVHGIFTGR